MRIRLLLLCAVILAACGQQTDEHQEDAAATESAKPGLSIYAAAVSSEARPDADRSRDAGRKPAEVLEFLGIAEGMTVLDMYSGGGYYTEILSYVVGDDGKVVAHSNQAYLNFVGEEFEKRYADDRLPNVEVLMVENNELSLEPNSFDALTLVLTFHDFVLDDADNGWPLIDVPALLAEFHKGLRPGGIVGIIDHHARAGAPAETGNTLHRIDPAIVVAAMEAAGFVLEEESDILRNPDDDLDVNVFDQALRGKTDRFLMRFRKQE